MTEQTPMAVKPCPFCGATPHRGLGKIATCQLHGDPLRDFSFWCPHGCAKITKATYPLALAAWNTRPVATPTTPKADDIAEGLRVTSETGANSHCFDDRIIVDGECIAFSDQPWTSRIVAALADRATASGEEPDEAAVERGAKSMWETDEHTPGHDTWSGLPEYGRDLWRDRARACLSATPTPAPDAVAEAIKKAVAHLMDTRRIGTASLNDEQRDYEATEMRKAYTDILTKAAPFFALPASQPVADVTKCRAAPDHADILETIENADPKWQTHGYTSALAEVRDMANVGRSFMERYADALQLGQPLHGFMPADDPAEAIDQLCNDITDADAQVATLTARVEALEGALRDLIEHADRMPKKTPSVGSCVTEHQFTIEAGTVWALDLSVGRARAALASDPACNGGE